MSIAVKQIFNNACQLAGLIDTDETVDGSLGKVCEIKLNELLQQLNLDQLFPFAQNIIDYTTVTNTNTLTIGESGADITAERPVFIERILYLATGDSNPSNIQGIDLPDLVNISTTAGQGTPSYFGVNATYPNSKIYFDVVLSAGSKLVIIYNKALPIVGVNDLISAPPEYSDLFVNGLARKVGAVKSVSAEIMQTIDILYKESITRITRNNSRRQVPLMNIAPVNNIYSYNAVGEF